MALSGTYADLRDGVDEFIFADYVRVFRALINDYNTVRKTLWGPTRLNLRGEGATGDGVTDDTLAIADVLTRLAAAGGGVAEAPPATYAISDLLTIPKGVNLVGAGTGKGGQASSATRFLCTTANAGIAFGSLAAATRGGYSGNFEVDGGDVATYPLRILATVHRTYDTIDVRKAAAGGAGLYLSHCQNNLFPRITIDDCAGDGLVFDIASNGNLFLLPQISNSGAAAGTNLANVKFTCSGPNVLGFGANYPQNNSIINMMCERDGGNLAAQVWYGAGRDNYLSGSINSLSATHVRINHDNQTDAGLATRLHLRDLSMSSNATPTPLVTAFDIADSAHLYLDGGLRVFNAAALYLLRGTGSRVFKSGSLFEQTITSRVHASSVGTHPVCVLPAPIGGAWDTDHLVLGAYHLWVDATGDLRIKSGAPTTDLDGAVVGAQT